MDITIAAPADWRNDRVALGFGLLAFLLHAMFAGRYDLFRDELYFIVCGRHPAFGYVDQPPLVPLLAAGLNGLGHSVWVLRLPCSLAAGALAWLAVRFARLLGGDAVAGAGAALSVTIAPMLMGIGATLNTTSFDPLAWTSIAWCLTYALKTGDRRALLLCGLIAGVDLEIKYAFLFWGVSLVTGLVLAPERRLLARKDLWLGVGTAAVLAAPSLVWQAVHGLPFLELVAAAGDKNTQIAPPAFVLNQFLVMSPMLAPVWLSGLVGPFIVAQLRPVRFLAIGFVTCAVLVILTQGKDYYLAACYPVMFIIGAVALTHWIKRPLGRAMLIGWGAAAIALSAWVSPLALPVLSVSALRTYVERSPVKPQQQEKNFQGTLLPQVFADQLGWRDFAAEVSGAWAQIPAAERALTSIKVDTYGEAAALDVYAQDNEMPPALSGHNQYFLWGLRGQHPANLLVVQNNPERLAPYCQDTTVLASTFSPDAMSYENGKAIVFCHGLKADLEEFWPQLKNYN
jgi:hypothetical protein